MNVEKPVVDESVALEWGSDYLADIIRQLDLKYLSINPGASLRGLHDSLVNYLGNDDPQMLLCLHEDHAFRSRMVMPRSPASPWAWWSTAMWG